MLNTELVKDGDTGKYWVSFELKAKTRKAATKQANEIIKTYNKGAIKNETTKRTKKI